MNPEQTQRAELTLKRGRQQVIADCVTSIGVLVWAYYSTHPATAERHRAIIESCWQAFRHRVSVWQTQQAIRNLPETRD